MVAERPVVAAGQFLEGFEREAARDHLVQAAADEIRVAAQQIVEALKLALERRAVARVQLPDLLAREVFQLQARADVEG